VGAVAEALKAVPGLPVESIAVPGGGEILPDTRRSDHSSFWDRGYPALMVTDTSFFRNPHYHQASDRPETLDYPFLARVTAGVCEAARRVFRARGGDVGERRSVQATAGFRGEAPNAHSSSNGWSVFYK